METLKSDVDAIEFLNAASDCLGDVWFYTAAGDEINLKSELSRCVFLVALSQPELLKGAKVKLSEERDLERLSPFFSAANLRAGASE